MIDFVEKKNVILSFRDFKKRKDMNTEVKSFPLSMLLSSIKKRSFGH